MNAGWLSSPVARATKPLIEATHHGLPMVTQEQIVESERRTARTKRNNEAKRIPWVCIMLGNPASDYDQCQQQAALFEALCPLMTTAGRNPYGEVRCPLTPGHIRKVRHDAREWYERAKWVKGMLP